MENLYEKKLTYNQISFRYSRGKSHVNGNEIHPYHEILYYIDGDVTFLSEEFQEDLSSGTLLLIPKASYHQFNIRNQSKYTRLVLNFPDVDGTEGLLTSAMSEIKIIRNLNSHLSGILQRMCQVVSSERPLEERSVFLQGAFLMLLAELNPEDVEISSPHPRLGDQLISRCIQYIDKNFTSDISAEVIAREMNVSISTLFHSFKKELGISLHKYIIEKRLIYAHKLISEGGRPSLHSFIKYLIFEKRVPAKFLQNFGVPPDQSNLYFQNFFFLSFSLFSFPSAFPLSVPARFFAAFRLSPLT